jgi:hypothetical protein
MEDAIDLSDLERHSPTQSLYLAKHGRSTMKKGMV